MTHFLALAAGAVALLSVACGHKCSAFYGCASTQAEADRLNNQAGCPYYHVCAEADAGDDATDAGPVDAANQ